MLKSYLRFVMLILLGPALAACNVLGGPDDPRETYDIVAPERQLPGGRTEAQLLVKEPVALKTLNSDRVVLKPEPRVVTYLEDAQWVDTAPKLVQARLVEAFENTGRTGATAFPGDGLVIDYQLVSTLRRFEIDGTTDAAVFEIAIKLLTDRTGQVRESRIFTARAPVNGTESADYIRALDQAFDAGAGEIIAWVLGSV